MNNHYIGYVSNRPPPSFRIAVDYHKDYMIILHPRDETYAKPMWVTKVLFKSKFVTFGLHFFKIQVEYHQPTARNEYVV